MDRGSFWILVLTICLFISSLIAYISTRNIFDPMLYVSIVTYFLLVYMIWIMYTEGNERNEK
jgi:putative effector of murein hydrolase